MGFFTATAVSASRAAGATSSAAATFASQSTVAAVRAASTLNIYARETPEKSASAFNPLKSSARTTDDVFVAK